MIPFSKIKTEPNTASSSVSPYLPVVQGLSAPSSDLTTMGNHPTQVPTAGNPSDPDIQMLEEQGGPNPSQVEDDQAKPGADHGAAQNGEGIALKSFAHPSFTDIGMKLKAFNDTLGELQQLGIQHVAQLPELVMVGDQSAGKSSLMSGLADLDLPCSGGVCTRCPIHIRLSRSSDPRWSCTVSLQLDHDFNPPDRAIKKTDVTKSHPFFPWQPKPSRHVKLFKIVDNQDEIEDVLRWAQVAILNPRLNHEMFIPGEGSFAKEHALAQAAASTEAQFSPNIVALEMRGPDLPDLSFYDLPGVFMSPPKESDEYIVKVVQNLAREYIKRPEAIILWAVPMNQDAENSLSLEVIRGVRAQDRTIGVMTKADKLPAENIQHWLAMLRGEKHSVGHGFFITSRPPGDLDVGNANKREEEFFQMSWHAEFTPFSSRCGVEVLKTFLSKKLGEAFSTNLPAIKGKIQQRLWQIEQRLKELPELPDNVEHEVRKSLHQFYHRVHRAVEDTSEFQVKWSELNQQFQHALIKMRPSCVLKDKDEPKPVICIDSDESDDNRRPRKRARDSGVASRPVATPTRRFRLLEETSSVSASTQVKTEGPIAVTSSITVGDGEEPASSPFAEFFDVNRYGLSIGEIRQEIARRKRAGVPMSIVPQEVYDTLAMRVIKKWDKPMHKYIQLTVALFSSAMHGALRESMAQLSRRVIYAEAKKGLDDYIRSLCSIQKMKILDLFNAESYKIFMLNQDSFKIRRDQEREILERMRTINRIKACGGLSGYSPKPWEEMTGDKRAQERVTLDQHLAKIGEDPYREEVGVAAAVRGYYVLAASRFAESVTLSVSSVMLRESLGHHLDMSVDRHLGLHAPSQRLFEYLMEEDINTAAERNQLKTEMDKLQSANRSIQALEGGHSASEMV